jgi:HD superfamily phosphohydrolase YqeK
MASSPSHTLHTRILKELEPLVAETYLLWDRDWVGFSWRAYTFDHVQRVRGLTRTIAAAEGGDPVIADLAALLHDIPKAYDGEVVMKDGKRVLDANGFWKNETLLPDRSNRVTEIYQELGLDGTLHNDSGAKVATALLRERGVDEETISEIAHAIEQHLRPHPTSSIEARALYDADTIDSNIGLPAFYRNIQISLHRLEQSLPERGDSLDRLLGPGLQEYLDTYLRERVPAWIQGKHNDFISRLTTEAGRQIGVARIERLSAVMSDCVSELDAYEEGLRHGRLSIVHRFMSNRKDPTLAEELLVMSDGWRDEVGLTAGATEFVELARRESDGEL